MGFLPQLKIAQKLPLALVGSALLVSVGVGIASYLIGSATVDQLSRRQIDTIARNSASELEAYFSSIAEDLVITATTESTQTVLRDFNITWGQFLTAKPPQEPKDALQMAYITNNPDPEQRELLDVSLETKRTNYDFAHSKVHPAFRRQQDARGYADLMLIDPDGNLIYSISPPIWRAVTAPRPVLVVLTKLQLP